MTLLPEVAEAALRMATSIRWLVETGQVQFANLDTSKIDDAPVPDWMQTAPPETLFLHDPERLKRMRSAIDEIRAKERAAKRRPKGLRTAAEPSVNSPKGRLRDRLLHRLLAKLSALQRP
ncbi:MAG: hypothetical protein HC783_14935 [Rhodobacteraceae bacterium]|nr:hypothetical protein [Paracoccaceae bacterium]